MFSIEITNMDKCTFARRLHRRASAFIEGGDKVLAKELRLEKSFPELGSESTGRYR